MTKWLIVRSGRPPVTPAYYWTGAVAEMRSLCQPVSSLDIDDANGSADGRSANRSAKYRGHDRMMRTAILGVLLLAGCAELQTYGAAAAERRKVMNDMQARGTMAAVCDVAIGSYWREFTAAERLFADEICGDTTSVMTAMERLEARE